MRHESIKLTLLLPPSVNGLYFNSSKGRTKTDEYKTFQELVWYHFKKNDIDYKITGNKTLMVQYDFFIPCYTKAGKIRIIDVFNLEKALSDTLQQRIPGFKDEKIFKGFVQKHDSERNEVDIIIKEI